MIPQTAVRRVCDTLYNPRPAEENFVVFRHVFYCLHASTHESTLKRVIFLISRENCENRSNFRQRCVHVQLHLFFN